MSKLSVAQPATTAAAIGPIVATATVSALGTIGGLLEVFDVWQDLLRKTVFPLVEIADGMDKRAFQRRLMSQQAMSVLMVVWKDSDHISDADVYAAGAERVGTSCAPINCHNLAKSMAVDINDLDRQEKKIQGIVKAAEAYGLIVREPFNNTRQRALRGTERLHRLMLDLDCEVRPICADIAASGQGGL
ncbi:hypothetical protein [Mesorhizobium sp. IMUNJ 23232]|uniref:hypothetical protein n=1 Tax=Mesorhizobium sp. IMUNJ 23232 TaxID=3376064 RepID=UPI0037ABB4DF